MDASTKISLCITTHNRLEMTLRSFQYVYDDPRINDIVVLDDASDGHVYHALSLQLRTMEKVQQFRSSENLGVYAAKKNAISLAYNKWCILLDSDNIITPDYIDALYNIHSWDTYTSYLPSFAKPAFDYRSFAGMTISKENVASLVELPMFDCLINTMNGFYYRPSYLAVWNDKVEPLTADSMYLNYLFLERGMKLAVVAGLEYEHTIHDGSHYKKHSHLNENFKKLLLTQYKSLR